MKNAGEKDSFVVDLFKDNEDAEDIMEEAENEDDKLIPVIEELVLKIG